MLQQYFSVNIIGIHVTTQQTTKETLSMHVQILLVCVTMIANTHLKSCILCCKLNLPDADITMLLIMKVSMQNILSSTNYSVERNGSRFCTINRCDIGAECQQCEWPPHLPLRMNGREDFSCCCTRYRGVLVPLPLRRCRVAVMHGRVV